mmetsp:Transcript_74762/g.207894  ORF Transcript_74762/g.207894 Transcript_74762/m.207894 type:complete len:304 (-) Transcript_74762:71-982(-)
MDIGGVVAIELAGQRRAQEDGACEPGGPLQRGPQQPLRHDDEHRRLVRRATRGAAHLIAFLLIGKLQAKLCALQVEYLEHRRASRAENIRALRLQSGSVRLIRGALGEAGRDVEPRRRATVIAALGGAAAIANHFQSHAQPKRTPTGRFAHGSVALRMKSGDLLLRCRRSSPFGRWRRMRPLGRCERRRPRLDGGILREGLAEVNVIAAVVRRRRRRHLVPRRRPAARPRGDAPPVYLRHGLVGIGRLRHRHDVLQQRLRCVADVDELFVHGQVANRGPVNVLRGGLQRPRGAPGLLLEELVA